LDATVAPLPDSIAPMQETLGMPNANTNGEAETEVPKTAAHSLSKASGVAKMQPVMLHQAMSEVKAVAPSLTEADPQTGGPTAAPTKVSTPLPVSLAPRAKMRPKSAPVATLGATEVPSPAKEDPMQQLVPDLAHGLSHDVSANLAAEEQVRPSGGIEAGLITEPEVAEPPEAVATDVTPKSPKEGPVSTPDVLAPRAKLRPKTMSIPPSKASAIQPVSLNNCEATLAVTEQVSTTSKSSTNLLDSTVMPKLDSSAAVPETVAELRNNTSDEAGTAVAIETHERGATQPSRVGTIEKWRVVWKGGVNVRSSQDKTSKALGSKPEGSTVEGVWEGQWLALQGEPGFMLVANGKTSLLEKVAEESPLGDHFELVQAAEEMKQGASTSMPAAFAPTAKVLPKPAPTNTCAAEEKAVAMPQSPDVTQALTVEATSTAEGRLATDLHATEESASVVFDEQSKAADEAQKHASASMPAALAPRAKVRAKAAQETQLGVLDEQPNAAIETQRQASAMMPAALAPRAKVRPKATSVATCEAEATDAVTPPSVDGIQKQEMGNMAMNDKTSADPGTANESLSGVPKAPTEAAEEMQTQRSALMPAALAPRSKMRAKAVSTAACEVEATEVATPSSDSGTQVHKVVTTATPEDKVAAKYEATPSTPTPKEVAVVLPLLASGVDVWRVIWKGGVNVRSKPDKTSSVTCSKPEGALVQGILEGPWLKLEGESGFMLATSGKNKLLEKTPVEAEASVLMQPDIAAASQTSTSDAVETWRVIWKGGVNVRSEQDRAASAVGTKPEGSTVRGVLHGQWLALDGEVGFMLVTSNSNKKLLEKVEA